MRKFQKLEFSLHCQSEGMLTFGQAVHDSKRKYRPPSVSFFDDHVDVGKLGEI